MARFQVKRNKKNNTEQGFISVPLAYWKKKGWKQGTQLSLIEGVDGSLIIRG